ncbi:hypothetical protein [Prevotella sp. 10(H)]|nr:hypothetical protein [Prevotella sp. 10(H)]
MEDFEFDDKHDKELKALKRKNRRQNMIWALIAIQAGSLILSYYLGRSHK